jgi:hypothetical protein
MPLSESVIPQQAFVNSYEISPLTRNDWLIIQRQQFAFGLIRNVPKSNVPKMYGPAVRSKMKIPRSTNLRAATMY